MWELIPHMMDRLCKFCKSHRSCPLTCAPDSVHSAARYVKEADKDIIKHLKGQGRLIDSSNYSHSYPFCWRSDTPLIQRVRSLFYPVIS